MEEKSSYDRADIRRMNVVSVLGQLRKHGALSRANIAVKVGLTRATASSIVTNLVEDSLVRESVYEGGRRGRPGLLVELNPNYGCLIAMGIDLDCISVLVANIGQEILWRKEVRISVGASSTETLSRAADLIQEAIDCGIERGLKCLGISLAWAGLVDAREGRLEHGPISGWSHIPLKADWEARFKLPVYVQNQAHAAAIGVHHFGPQAGVQNMIYLSFGVGLAAGVYVDGSLLQGRSGYAGQVGHMYFKENDITCSCGKKGCWVTEVGFGALLRKLAEVGVEFSAERPSEMDILGLVYQLALRGDESVLKVLNSIGYQIGLGIAQLVQTFNSSQIIIGGQMGQLMHLAQPTIEAAVYAQTLPYMAEELDIVFRDSDDDWLIGGLATVFDVIMTNP